jgi:hypothetical protein
MQLSKINQRILAACQELYDLVNYDHVSDFDERDGHLVANIKMRNWLRDSDIENAMFLAGVTQEKREEVEEEFDDERLQGIMEHCGQWEIECFKEEFGSKSQMEERNGTYPYSKFAEAVWLIDGESKDVWQFGRSGGWLSFAKKDILEFSYNENDETICADEFCDKLIDWENGEFNEEIERHLYRNIYKKNKQGGQKRVTLDTYRAKLELIGRLEMAAQDIRDKVEACEVIVEWIKDCAKNFIVTCQEQLNHEVSEFWEEIKEEGTLIGIKSNASIRIEGDVIKTSLGASVPLEEAKRVFYSIEFVGDFISIGKEVGKFKVENARRFGEDWLIKAGCHKLLLSQVKTIFND